MRGKIKHRIINVISLIVILLSQFANVASYVSAQAGDDPGVTITAPDVINSRDQVELKVSVATSAGNLDEDGTVAIKIPKSIVPNPNELTSQLVIGSPFYLDVPAYIDDGQGNYVLNVKYDHTKIDQNNAQGYNFTIKFTAPVMEDGNTSYPDSVDFVATLDKNGVTQSTDSAHSDLKKSTTTLPLLKKDSTQPIKNVLGQNAHILSNDVPSRNVFRIVVNYSQQNVKGAKVVDNLPAGTTLTDPNTDLPATGDSEIYQHLRILKVTSFDATGIPDAWQYVTSQFQNKITTNGTSFSVDFGDLTTKDSYVISYSVAVENDPTQSDFGIQTNHSELQSEGNVIRTSDVDVALDTSEYSAASLNKIVSQNTLSTNTAQLEYKLKLASTSNVIKAGTVINDPLPVGTKFVNTVSNSDYDDAVYNQATNTVSYTLKHDLNAGDSATVGFNVDYSDANVKVGDKIVNKANFDYAGSTIYSNDATTVITGSANLKKVDSLTGAALAGAEFKIVDKTTGNTVASNLVTDASGNVNSGLLSPGKYAFVETKAPAGYLLDPTPNDFEVISGQTTGVDLTMKNHESIKIEGDKTWDDNDDQDGVRPDSINVNLLANGKVIQTKKITAADNWHYEFKDLPKDDNGKEIVYTITEDSIPEYTTEINGFDIINHYIPGKTSATVTKKWDDENNKDGIRTSEVKVQLYGNGKPVGNVVALNDANQWTYTWTGLDQKAKGQDIKYTVKEVDVPGGYQSDVNDNDLGNMIITNTHRPMVPVTPTVPKTPADPSKPTTPDIPDKPSNPSKPSSPKQGSFVSKVQNIIHKLPQTGEDALLSKIITGVGVFILAILSYFYFNKKRLQK